MYSPSLWVVFSLSWWLLSEHKKGFTFWCSPPHLFFSHLDLLSCIIQGHESVLLHISCKSFAVLPLGFRYVIQFELVFYLGLDRSLNSSFCTGIFHCFSAVYWKDCSFFIKWPWNPCQKLVDDKCLFLASQFHSVDQCPPFWNTTASWLLQFCSQFWTYAILRSPTLFFLFQESLAVLGPFAYMF